MEVRNLRRQANTFDVMQLQNARQQVIFACIISLASLQLYVRFAPYMDEEVDKISTVAQLMTFTQLFGALLISVRAPALTPSAAERAQPREERQVIAQTCLWSTRVVPPPLSRLLRRNSSPT